MSARFLAVLVAVFGVVAFAHKGAHTTEPADQVYPAHLTEYSLEGYTAMMYGNGTIAAVSGAGVRLAGGRGSPCRLRRTVLDRGRPRINSA